MTKIIHGIVHGRTIVLAEDPGVADGAEVEVVVMSAAPPKAWGGGILRSAGALADSWTEEDDRVLQQLRQDRSQERRPQLSE